MALLYSEKGNTVHLYDVDFSATESVLKEAQETKNLDDKLIHIHKDLDGFMKDFSSGEARLIIFSLPHGKTTDKIIEQLIPNLKKGDIILDGGNEHYKSTERRQRYLKEKGVAFIGCGVSGGYQASRHGPSMSPGGDFEAYKKVRTLKKLDSPRTDTFRPADRAIVERLGSQGCVRERLCRMGRQRWSRPLRQDAPQRHRAGRALRACGSVLAPTKHARLPE